VDFKGDTSPPPVRLSTLQKCVVGGYFIAIKQMIYLRKIRIDFETANAKLNLSS